MDGIVTLLKPPGMTSSNAVYDVRRIFSEKRAGHLGTLDPGAAGVLPVCIGRATRLFDYLVDKEKEYLFEIAFGVRTDTQDAYGQVLETDDRIVTREALEAALPAFLGVQEQTAPIYSALKVDGRKMYDLARAGEAIEPRVRRIEIPALEFVREIVENRFLLRIRCSRGTYVRTVCEDLGRAVGSCAYMSLLLRVRSGPFTLDRAYSVAELAALMDAGRLSEAVTSPEDALSFLPKLELPPDRLVPTRNALDTFVSGVPDGNVRLYCGQFLGVGSVRAERVTLSVHLY